MNTATNLIDDLRLLEAPKFWVGWWLVGFVVLAVALGVFIWRRRLAALRDADQGVVAMQAQEDALVALQKARPLMAEVTAKLYAIEVSGIIRRYIERRFGIRAPHRSTEEFIVEAQQSPKLDPRHRQLLTDFLGTCDFLKFARGLAEFSELETVHHAAVGFVSETLLREAAPATTPNREALV
jgi:hypothetical protein